MAEAALVQERYAMETRAQVLRLVSADTAVRRGESDRFEIGRTASLDAVDGSESLDVGGDLVEHLHSRAVDAMRLETHVGGGLAMRSHSDITLLGGAMAETYAGPVLVAAGLSDELIAGGGIRVAAVDLRLAGLLGGEERVGTAQADGALVEAYATHFEREFGSGVHVADFARFSGAVFATAASGFRPLFKVMRGVRNLTAGTAASADASMPPPTSLSVPHGSTGLLATTRAIAPPASAVAGLGASAFNAERLGDFSHYLKRAEDTPGARLDVAAGRSAGTAESLADLRRLTRADVDESLARLRARANLPDDAGMDQVIDFLDHANSGQIGDLEVQRASLALREDLAAATRPFLQLLVARGIPSDDLDALALSEQRGVFSRELKQACASGDGDADVDLLVAFIGFDTIVFRRALALVERFADLAADENSVPAALASARLPPSGTASAELAPDLAALLVDRLLDLQLDWADEPIRIGLLELAIDEARHGNDPMPAIDDYLRLVIRHGSETMELGELDALQEVVATIRLTIDDAINGTAADVAAAADLAELDECDAARFASDAHAWRNLAAGGSLADTSAGETLLGRVHDANVRNLNDLTLDDDARVADRVAAYGDVGDSRSRAKSVFGTEPEVVFPPSGDYPFVSPRLPADVDAGELSRTLRGYRATLMDPATGLPPQGAAASDVLVCAKRRAVTGALDALGRGQDPAVVLDEQIRAAKRGANPPTWVVAPSGLPLIDDDVDVLREVRDVVNGLLEQNRSGAPPANVGEVDETGRIHALRQQSGAMPGGAMPAGAMPGLDYVTSPAMRPSGLRADIHLCAGDHEDIADLAAANIPRGDLDAAGDACATVAHRGRQRRLGDVGQLEAGVAAWTILADDSHRIGGFLVDDRRGRLPVLRATRAEQEAIDNGDIVVRIIDVETFKTYDDFEMTTNLADDFSHGRPSTVGPASARRRNQRLERSLLLLGSSGGLVGDVRGR